MKKKFLDIGSEKLAYLDIGTSKEVMVLVHGNMSSGIHYKPLIERFKDDYRIIAPDMRGFGDSSYNNRYNDLEELADDLLLLLDKLNIHEYHLAGWSTGGAVALKIAAKRPKEVKNVILIESCSYKGYPVFKKDENGQPIVGSYYATKEELALDPVQVAPMENIFNTGASAYMTAVWDQLIYTVNKPTPEDAELYMSETMKEKCIVDVDWALTRFNMSNDFNGVTKGDGSIKDVVCPVISFWSEKDIVVLEYMVDETVAALNNCKKVKLPNSGHSPLLDQPDLLAKEILEFIK
ncbi:alpha/beta fold hydrolase [Candidatus Izemoplasma sp. B36]|uniref:intracellular short-chain-length polyhydroxyalkanoate depolymerase n=1 Tax=Candidatus Izemoplasma sp. B36 TaxID=3242468 RepID=UPI0035562301